MFGQRDAAFGFEARLRPKPGHQNREGEPAKTQGQIVEPFQVVDDRHLPAIQDDEKIFGGRFNQFYAAEGIEGSTLHGAGAAGPGGRLAVHLHLGHDPSPRPFGKERVLGRQTRFEYELIEAGIVHGLALDFEQAQSGFFVFGGQGLLFARAGILQIIHFQALVEVEPLLHIRMIVTERVTPLGCCSSVLSNGAGVLPNCKKLAILLAILLAFRPITTLFRGHLEVLPLNLNGLVKWLQR